MRNKSAALEDEEGRVGPFVTSPPPLLLPFHLAGNLAKMFPLNLAENVAKKFPLNLAGKFPARISELSFSAKFSGQIDVM